MKKRVLAIAATAMATMMMATPVLAEDYKIGICNYVDDASLNQIVDNIQSRLEELGKEKGVTFDVSYDNCNADASVMEQIISDFQADNVDLMVGVATPVAMRMQSATEGSDTPVVFSAVSDPVGSGLVDSLEAPGANITGTSDYLDTSSIMKLIQAQNPDVKKIGLLYDVGQDSSTTAIQEAKDYLNEKGFNGDAADDLYTTMIGDPAVYQSYSTGFYEMQEIRDYAEEQLGSKFDLKEFNTVVLETGPCQFNILKQQVQKYIDTKQ